MRRLPRGGGSVLMQAGPDGSERRARHDHPLGRLFPGAPERLAKPWAAWLALVALVLLPLTALAARDFADGSLYLLAIVSAFTIASIRQRDPHWWVVLILIPSAALMLLVNADAADRYPDLLSKQWVFSERYLFLFGFLFVGFWLGGTARAGLRFLALAFVGLLLEVAKNSEAGDWLRLISWTRTDFGFINAQHSAVLFGSALLAAVTLWRWWWRPGGRAAGDWVSRVCGIAVTLFSFMVVMGSQTRQVWLGLMVAAVAVAVVAWMAMSGHAERRRRFLRRAALGGLVMVAAMMAVTVYSESFRAKMIKDWAAVEQFIASDGEQATSSSSTVRLMQWQFALKLISERPLAGYGPASTQHLIAESELPAFSRVGFGHLHNSYFELAVSYGLPALGLFVGLLVLLVHRLGRAFKRGFISLDVALFGAAWLSFFALINLFESYVLYRTGFILLAVCGGVIYSLTMVPAGFDPESNESNGLSS